MIAIIIYCVTLKSRYGETHDTRIVCKECGFSPHLYGGLLGKSRTFYMSSIKKFRRFLRVDKGFASKTIEGYVGTVERFVRDIGHDHDENDAYAYINEMYEQDQSASYIINTSVVLERWYRFNGMEINLGRPKKPDTLIPETLTEGEMARIIATAKNIREKAIVSVLAYSGVRNVELRRLRVRHVDFHAGCLRIKSGKGKRDRIAYLNTQTLMTIRQYLDEYPRSDQEYLFTTLEGNQYSGFALRKLVKTLAERAGLEKRVYPHLFRHSLATNMLNRGCPVMTIKEVLGHKNIESTMKYVHSNPRRIKREYNLYCPMYL